MNRRQKIIVSVTGIFLVLLILVGLTYAYFLTRIVGNTNDKSISVTTANLSLKYDDGTGVLTAESKLVPDTTVSTKTFSVENNGDATIDEYAVILEDLKIYYANTTGTVTAGTPTYLEYPDTMELSITCNEYKTTEYSANPSTATSLGACSGYEGAMPTTNDILLTNEIEVGITQVYNLTLRYLEAGYDQSKDMNKTIEGKINIIDTKVTMDIEGTLASYAAGDYVQVNSEPKVSYPDKNGEFKVIGVKPGEHTVAVYNTSDISTPKSSTSVTIQRGNTASVNNSVITVTDTKRVATINISDSTYTIDNTIKGINTFKEGTLAYSILDNAQNNTNGTTYVDSPSSKVAAEISGETEKVLSKTTDDYGVSYYYRGAVEDNYVNYNGMCFRIVRIEGDGSTKLVLEDASAECNSADYTGNWGVGQSTYGVDRFTGALNSTINRADYLEPSHNSSGAMKTMIDTWFTSGAFDTNDLKEDTWCLGNITDVYTTSYPYTKLSNETTTRDSLIESETAFYYESFTRFGDEGVEGEQYATLKCEKNNYTSFESYTSTLTADELIYAGAKQGSANTNFYLHNDYHKEGITWFTLTLGKFSGTQDRVIGIDTTGGTGNMTAGNNNFSASGNVVQARPAITLKTDIIVSSTSGNGLKTNPYVID